MPAIEQSTRLLDELRQHHLLRLHTLAHEQAFWLGVEGVIVSGYAASIGRQAMEALHAGLTSEEILAALNAGEQRGLPIPTEVLLFTDEALTPDYWQAIQTEAETYWSNR